MRRWHQDYPRTVKQQTIAIRGQFCHTEAGRYRKRKALDCGKPRCKICHWNKVLDLQTKHDRINELNFIEGVADLLEKE